MATIKTSVVIPYVHDSEELVQLTRDVLYSLRGQYDELVLVDDGSGIKGSEFMSQAQVYIENFTNEGYIKSANKGIQAARGKTVVLVCNDTKLIQGKLAELTGDGYRFPVIEGKDRPFWDGAFYAFPKAIGGQYDERFHTYFGDLDKFYSAKQQGIPLTQVPSVMVHHTQSATTNYKGIRQSQYEADHLTFIEKWGFDPLDNYLDLI